VSLGGLPPAHLRVLLDGLAGRVATALFPRILMWLRAALAGGFAAHTARRAVNGKDRDYHACRGEPEMAEVCHHVYTSPMALSIKSDEADQLARELAAETGETLTEAVVIALRERLDREHARHAASMRARLARLAADVAALPVADSRTPEEIIGYDDAGLPH
jgi:antitoxin VapB